MPFRPEPVPSTYKRPEPNVEEALRYIFQELARLAKLEPEATAPDVTKAHSLALHVVERAARKGDAQ